MHVPVFIVNLPSSTVRKEHMIKECQRIGLSFEFIEAVNGRELDLSALPAYDAHKCQQVLGRDLRLGEIGCLLSHQKIYQKIVDNGIPYALILEDDVALNKDVVRFLQDVSQFPSDWELILLGHYAGHDFNLMQLEVRSPSSFWGRTKVMQGAYQLVRLVRPAYGTHGYLVSQRGAQKLLKALTRFYQPIDHYTGNDVYTNLYAVEPVLVTLDEGNAAHSEIDLLDNREARQERAFWFKFLLKKVGLLDLVRECKRLPSRLRHLPPYK